MSFSSSNFLPFFLFFFFYSRSQRGKMTGVKVIHHGNNKRNNSKQQQEIKWLLENCICLVLSKVKGQCQTIILRKILQRKMDFFTEEMLKGNQKSLLDRGNNILSNMDPIPSTIFFFFLVNIFNKLKTNKQKAIQNHTFTFINHKVNKCPAWKTALFFFPPLGYFT